MQFSKKCNEHIESCRFCWMCHHICPIGNATGLERNTARARALGLSLVSRGAVEYSDDIISNVYECSLCGGCVYDCITGLDPIIFTKEARLMAALEGKLPSYITEMLKNLFEKGNIYGKDKDPELVKTISELGKSDTLLFLGGDAPYKCPDKAIGAINLLKKLNVNFTVLSDEPTSGYSLDFMIGAANETKSAMESCAKAVSVYKKVICYDPADAKVFLREYKEWGIDIQPEVVTFTSFLSDFADKLKRSELVFTPQDSHLLSRDLEECEPIRIILSACGDICEMHLNRAETMLAGNLIMNEYMPMAIEAVARNRWINALNMNVKILVTASPAEYVMLAKTKPEDAELLTVEEAMAKCL